MHDEADDEDLAATEKQLEAGSKEAGGSLSAPHGGNRANMTFFCQVLEHFFPQNGFDDVGEAVVGSTVALHARSRNPTDARNCSGPYCELFVFLMKPEPEPHVSTPKMHEAEVHVLSDSVLCMGK